MKRHLAMERSCYWWSNEQHGSGIYLTYIAIRGVSRLAQTLMVALIALSIRSASCRAEMDAEATPRAISPTSVDGTAECRSAAAKAEQEDNLPPGLLLAIGQQESGRWNPVAGQADPTPYAINAGGVSRFFVERGEAVDYVTSQRRSGVLSIDVGCFQINLLHHPAAFSNLAEAFDPLENARYAARFLASLHAESGSWEAAIGRYHSGTAGLAQPYMAAVLSRWKQPSDAGQRTDTMTRTSPRLPGTVNVYRPGDSYGVIRLSSNSFGMPRVITPTAQVGRSTVGGPLGRF